MTKFVVSTKNHYKISFVKRFALENTPAPKTSNFLNNARQSRIEYIFALKLGEQLLPRPKRVQKLINWRFNCFCFVLFFD